MAVIELEVDEATAQKIRAASDEERAAYGGLLADLLHDRLDRQQAGERLRQSMDELSREAEANGLTPEILEEILRDG